MRKLEETLSNIEEILEVASSVADGRVKLTEEGIKQYASKGYLQFLWASITSEYVRILELHKFARDNGLKRASEEYKIKYLRLKGPLKG